MLQNIGGFNYQTRLRETNPSAFYPKAIVRLARFLDNPAAWRPRWYVIPQQATAIDPWGAQLIQQVQLRQGSYIVGLQATALSGTLADFSVQVRWDFEAGTAGLDLFSAPISAALLAPNGVSGLPQVLLPEPKEVSGEAIVTVILQNNNAGSARQCQLVLKALEPVGGVA